MLLRRTSSPLNGWNSGPRPAFRFAGHLAKHVGIDCDIDGLLDEEQHALSIREPQPLEELLESSCGVLQREAAPENLAVVFLEADCTRLMGVLRNVEAGHEARSSWPTGELPWGVDQFLVLSFHRPPSRWRSGIDEPMNTRCATALTVLLVIACGGQSGTADPGMNRTPRRWIGVHIANRDADAVFTIDATQQPLPTQRLVDDVTIKRNDDYRDDRVLEVDHGAELAFELEATTGAERHVFTGTAYSAGDLATLLFVYDFDNAQKKFRLWYGWVR